MISFSEQFSAARKAQVDHQIEFMRALTAQAVATAGQVLALNINTSRESAARTADTVRQMCAITDPRDLFTLGAHTQEQLSSLYNYGRELMNIAADARLGLTRRVAGQPAPQPQADAAPLQPAAPEAATAPVVEVAPEAEAVPAQPEIASAAVPRTKAKPIARAVGKVVYAHASAEVPHPAAAPIDEAGATVDGLVEVKPRQPRAAKAQRKK